MALLALILASSLNQAAAPVFKFDRAPFIASACDAQVDAKFVHPLPLTPSLRNTVHLTQGEAAACLQRGPDIGRRITKRYANAPPPADEPVQPIQQDPQAPPP